MKVILKERVPTLGNVGDILNVSQGYARNYLIPKKLAIVADYNNERVLEHNKRILSSKIKEEKKLAIEVKKKLESVNLQLERRVGPNGRLYGTVSTMDLSKELKKNNFDIEKRIISLPKPIKTLGEFDANVKLFSDIEASFKVTVNKDESIDDHQELSDKKKKSKSKKSKEEDDNLKSEITTDKKEEQ